MDFQPLLGLLHDAVRSPLESVGFVCADVLLLIWVRMPVYAHLRRRRAEKIRRDPFACAWGPFFALIFGGVWAIGAVANMFAG